MHISFNWLRDFIKTDLSALEIGDMLTNLGLEVEGITQYHSIRGGLEGVVNGKIDEWSQQIRNATNEASNTHSDAIDLNSWEDELNYLKYQLNHARNN